MSIEFAALLASVKASLAFGSAPSAALTEARQRGGGRESLTQEVSNATYLNLNLPPYLYLYL